MLVFSVNKFIKDCREEGVHTKTIMDALSTWAKECDGKTEEEIKAMKLKMKFFEEWFEER